MFEQRKAQYETILDNLLAAPALRFDNKLRSQLPPTHGLYVITRNSGPQQVEYLHAGRSRTAAEGLRSRIWDQHFCGGGRGAAADLVQKVIDHEHTQLGILRSHADKVSRAIAQKWIQEKCLVQWIALDDPDLTGWAEHYVLSILCPTWGR